MIDSYLEHYRRLLSIAEAGLFYGEDLFDKERYEELQELSLKLISNLSNEPIKKLKNIVDSNEGYPTPKIDVRGYIKKNDKILLVEDAKTKKWAMPGGYAEVGLSPKENVIKEVLEETGLIVESCELIAVFDTNLRKDIPQMFQYYKLVFNCIVNDDGLFKENIETSDMDFFTLDNLPSLSLDRTTKEQLIKLSTSTKVYFD
ncbi:ADP-ribose pyrophosphatase YjhB, NUDIX family [Carnobacterium viridans]|uniref:ADP-ribose pyrophosphatase YjhB, NUDIX family n=1 Tax=Carnobacterium viridans TaxID=174587 RepID=A0A1H0Y2M2_9LACT|nr:ADP-ribose pyrophosphatase YjhB, NUDIX family [Carnobacterium viridans]